MGTLAQTDEWESAAEVFGLTVVKRDGTCPDCNGEGAHLSLTDPYWSDRWVRCETCEGSGKVKTYTCPASGDEFRLDEMGWVEDGLGTVVSAASQIGCELCGDRPHLPGEDYCSECLHGAPTARSCDLMLGAAQ